MTTYSDKELYSLSERVRDAAKDEPRYRPTGRATRNGEIEMIDIVTRKRGVYCPYYGIRFSERAYIDSNGQIAYERPSQNPFHGWRP